MSSRNRGWILSDAVMAIGILMVLSGIVVTEISWRAKATQHLQALRIATNEAEMALSSMQQGHSPQFDRSDTILVEPIAADAGPSNWRWVRVTARHDGEHATLIGLVQAAAVGGK